MHRAGLPWNQIIIVAILQTAFNRTKDFKCIKVFLADLFLLYLSTLLLLL